jgi:hypothetical protein
MAIADDLTVSLTGDIRWVGTTATYTVLALHRFLQDLADDASASGDDLVDITSDNPSNRETDTYITLLNSYNIDDVAARHFYGGSIVQDDGDTIYDGVVNYGNAGVALQIVQNGAVLSPNFWGTALNADATNGISHQFLVKTRTGGADIDGRRLIGFCRTFGNLSDSFTINGTARGQNVLAVGDASDLNNTTAIATVAGWTTITNTEGYRAIDADGNLTDEHYFSEWNRDSYTINQLYERTKWLARAATADYFCADTGSDFVVGNGTIAGQAQSFANGANAQYLVRARVSLKKVGSPTGNLTVTLHAHSGTYGTSSVPTGAALATSGNLDVSTLTTAYQTIELAFATPYELEASTNYVLAVNYSNGDGSNYVHAQGLATTGTHAGNRSETTGSWSATAGDDLFFYAYVSPDLYGLPGELFRGVTHQITIDNPTGEFDAVEPVSWSGGTGQMLAIDSTTAGTTMWIQLRTGVAPTNDQTITGGTSSATADVNTTVTTRTLSSHFLGQSTGSALLGAYGIGVEAADLGSSDRLTDLANTVITPPNNVVFTVYGLTSSEDRVLAMNDTGTAMDWSQLELDTTLSGATETSVVVTTAIPGDTPSTGWLRVTCDSGQRRIVAYTGWASDTFTIGSTDFSGDNATAGNDVGIAYLDLTASATTAAFTGVYVSDRTIRVRVRDGGATPIKPFETTGTLGSAGGSATAIRTSDA